MPWWHQWEHSPSRKGTTQLGLLCTCTDQLAHRNLQLLQLHSRWRGTLTAASSATQSVLNSGHS